jgi:hypothetical protein
MVELKPEKASNFLKDKIPLLFIIIFITYGCESSFKNFDIDLIDKQIELQDFGEKSIVSKEEILENIDE